MAACLIPCMTIQTDILGNEENAMPSVVEKGRHAVGGGRGGRGERWLGDGKNRFRRDGTKGRRPWFYLNDLTLGRSRSSALWGRSRCVGHGEVFGLPTVESYMKDTAHTRTRTITVKTICVV